MEPEAAAPRADKKSLRQEFIQARREFSKTHGSAVRDRLSENMRRLIQDLTAPQLQVGLYRPMSEEAAFDLQPSQQFFYPVLAGQSLKFYSPRGKWLNNVFGISEPDPKTSEAADPNKPMLIFCPAVAVDHRGTRLGMGKGFYDRFFHDHPNALRVGVIYHSQLSKDPLPADSWDQALDWIVSENLILRLQPRSLQ